jgi:hypothetical protein
MSRWCARTAGTSSFEVLVDRPADIEHADDARIGPNRPD